MILLIAFLKTDIKFSQPTQFEVCNLMIKVFLRKKKEHSHTQTNIGIYDSYCWGFKACHFTKSTNIVVFRNAGISGKMNK